MTASAASLKRHGVCIGVLGLVVACGGKSAADHPTQGNAGASATAGASGSPSAGDGSVSGSGGSTNGPCPVAPPVNGAPCKEPYTSTELDASQCSYGDDPRPGCRTNAICDTGAWAVSTPKQFDDGSGAQDCATPPLPAACPMPPPSQTSACSDATLSCWYDEGTRCWCSSCKLGTQFPVCQTVDPPQWYCATPAAGCPALMPQAGTPCSTPGASCGPDCTLLITCTDSVWHWERGNCPICAAPDTPIATPHGERPIASLRVGDLVYSVDHDAIVAVPLLKVGHTSVAQHHVVRVVLAEGRVLQISPGHPTADGRTFGDLVAGGRLDAEHWVQSAELVPYAYDATYDILPASSTGTYYAAGAQIGSTFFGR
ncbi:MAG TPA: Hint domain-containing protein [Polyangiaceae bacterium]